jgi:hypothetical protein
VIEPELRIESPGSAKSRVVRDFVLGTPPARGCAAAWAWPGLAAWPVLCRLAPGSPPETVSAGSAGIVVVLGLLFPLIGAGLLVGAIYSIVSQRREIAERVATMGTVLYKPANPRAAEIDSAVSRWLAPVVMGCLFLLLGLAHFGVGVLLAAV